MELNINPEAFEVLKDMEQPSEMSPYAERVQSLSKEERTQVLASIKEYTNSDEYKELKEYCENKYNELRESIIPALRNRKECKATKSLLDTFLVQYDVFNDIYQQVSNKYVKEYILEEKLEAIKRIIELRRSTMENVIDMPFATDLDMIKAEKEVYNSFDILIASTYELYDKERTREKRPDLQPYE